MQEQILLRLYPWKTLEEAKEAEIWFWCRVISKVYWECMVTKYIRQGSSSSEWYDWYRMQNGELYFSDYRTGEICYIIMQTRQHAKTTADWWDVINDKSIRENFDIIWLPPTLPRVLQALGDLYWRWHRIIWLENKIVEIHRERIMEQRNFEDLCNRKLLNSDNTDATLFDQDQSTQDAIALLLWWKDETTKK